ncbi:helix-turn-helix domain-containing protein [Leptobacterium flavescens]|uniref:Helix-turn-helix domain-containing protein n=1 Tax=Leptobacterium flavescens TaxID=472055 RepID=A0A6P0UX22_9FLAO|nr:AraC family transcriptional regulator [Leptobacterium flavescens]NER15283.1 helix-turn-helix domain-containing protein [Leptobacterium flavescens]
MANSTLRLLSDIIRLSCVLFFSFTSFSFAQNQEPYYTRTLQEWKDASYGELVTFLERPEEIKSTEEIGAIADLILKEAFKKNRPEYPVQSYHLLARAYQYKESYELGINNINQAIRHANRHPRYQDKAPLYLTKALLLYDLKDYEGAMKNNLKVLSYAKKEKNRRIKLKVNYNIALIKTRMNNFTGALDIHLKNLNAFKNEGLTALSKDHQVLFLHTLIAISRIQTDLENYSEANEYCNEVIKYSEILGLYKYKAYGFLGLGNLYSLTCKYYNALQNLGKAERTELYETDIYFHSQVHLYRARTYFHQKHYKKTIKELHKAEDYFDPRFFNPRDSHEINVLYARSYQNLEDLESASRYSNNAFDFYESNKRRLNVINTSLTSEYDMSFLREEIDELSLRSKIQRNKSYTALTALLLVSFFFLIYYQKQQARNKRIFDALILDLDAQKDITVLEPVRVAQKEIVPKKEDRKFKELLEKITIFEKENGYLDNHCTLNEVAKRLKTNTSYLSKFINNYKGVSFTKYLTELRIDYALNRLKNDKQFRKYTIKSIAQEVGFNSPEPFAKAFKKKTGIYPSYFIKKLG